MVAESRREENCETGALAAKTFARSVGRPLCQLPRYRSGRRLDGRNLLPAVSIDIGKLLRFVLFTLPQPAVRSLGIRLSIFADRCRRRRIADTILTRKRTHCSFYKLIRPRLVI